MGVAPGARLEGLDDLTVAYRSDVRVEPLASGEVEALIDSLTQTADGGTSRVVDQGEDEEYGVADARDLANQAPVIRYVNALLRDAHESGASDIHIERAKDGWRSRYRVDGVLTPGLAPPAGCGRAVVSRIKLLSELDIAERRRPQDGRLRVRLESSELDVRVSTAPTLTGESVVLRLLNRSDRQVQLPELGLPVEIRSALEAAALRPHGMLLATGPTGSGKTTTLHTALALRDLDRENVVTVEDPVEYVLEGVSQVPVHSATGVTFASVLRSILRQDPDVLLVGEMRDAETASLAVQAALTGHMVFSTLHTNDALGAIPRLLDLGLPAFLVSATLDAVLAQRLVRKICPNCRERSYPDRRIVASVAAAAEADASLVAEAPFAHGRGCEACRGTGFRGRIGLFELLVMTDDLRDLVARGFPRRDGATCARESGYRPLAADGWVKACEGITTLEEVLRATRA